MDAPLPKESEMQIALVEAIKLAGVNPQWKFSHIGHGEKRDIGTALKLQKMGVRKGVTDFIFIGPRQILFLELKREGGRLTPEQEVFRDHVICCGFHYHLAYDVPDALGTLFDLGITKRMVVVQ